MIKRALVLAALVLAACSPQAPGSLLLHPDAAQVRVFAEPNGYTFPDGVSLDHIVDRESGAVLSEAEAEIVSSSLSTSAYTNAACEPVWRVAFVFYDAEGAPLGGVGYDAACDAVTVVEAAASSDALAYGGAELDAILAAHELTP